METLNDFIREWTRALRMQHYAVIGLYSHDHVFLFWANLFAYKWSMEHEDDQIVTHQLDFSTVNEEDREIIYQMVCNGTLGDIEDLTD